MVRLLLFGLFDRFNKCINLALADRLLLRRFDHVIYLLCISFTMAHLHFFVVLFLFVSTASATSPSAVLGFEFFNFRSIGLILIFVMNSDARFKARHLYVHLVDCWNLIILVWRPLKFLFRHFEFWSILQLHYYFFK